MKTMNRAFHPFRMVPLLFGLCLFPFLTSSLDSQETNPVKDTVKINTDRDRDREERQAFVTPLSRKAARRGEQWLNTVQKRSGAWSCEPDTPPSVSITSLAMLSIMAGGKSPDVPGESREELRDGLDWLLRRPSHGHGFVSTYDATGLGPMYDHACAVLLLSQLNGEIRYRALKVQDVLEDAVNFLEGQQRASGGWGRGRANLGITGAVFQALRSADSNGISLEASMNETLSFARRCSISGNGFALHPRGRSANRLFWSTSAGLRILMGTGNKRNKEIIKNGFETVVNRKLGRDTDGKVSEWDYAGLLMLTQAMLLERGSYWKQWYPMIREQLLKLQNDDGSWEVEYCKECRGFATSVAILFLRSPYLLLPIYQK